MSLFIFPKFDFKNKSLDYTQKGNTSFWSVQYPVREQRARDEIAVSKGIQLDAPAHVGAH